MWGIWCEADEVQDPVSVKQTHFTIAGGKENGSVKFWQLKWDKSVWEPAINCLCVFQILEAFYFLHSVVKSWYKLLADAYSSISTLKSPWREGEKGEKKISKMFSVCYQMNKTHRTWKPASHSFHRQICRAKFASGEQLEIKTHRWWVVLAPKLWSRGHSCLKRCTLSD